MIDTKEETEDDEGLINKLLDKVGNISNEEYEELYNQSIAIELPTTVLEQKDK